jgi:hypothetical protein
MDDHWSVLMKVLPALKEDLGVARHEGSFLPQRHEAAGRLVDSTGAAISQQS